MMHLLILLAAKYLYIVIVVAAVIYWLRRNKQQKIHLAIFACVTVIATFILVKFGASLYFDPRPFVAHTVTAIYPHAPDNGFPSDHTALTMAIAVAIYSRSSKLGITLAIAALIVGVARVLGNIHSPIDIAGSVVCALVGGLVALYLTPILYKKLHARVLR
jgi:undecaprenyl-diphosphatase